MKINEKIMARSGGKCELCQKEGALSVFRVSPDNRPDNEILICSSLIPQIEGTEELNASEEEE